MIKQLTIIGVGLIGGSLALALKRASYVEKVVGHGHKQASLERAVELGVVDAYELDIEAAVKSADVVLLAVPMGVMDGVFAAISSVLPSKTIVTDAGSAKGSVVASARNHFKSQFNQFVPGHPIAGTERSGVEAAFPELYGDRRVLLTPVEETSPEALQCVRAMWEATGAIVEEMSVETHDEMLAATSHLPHILAFNLMNTLVQIDKSEGIFRFSAGGFRDFTRIASSNPPMWRDICLTNKEAVLAVLDQYESDLALLRTAIEKDDGEGLLDAFSRAKAVRDRHIK